MVKFGIGLEIGYQKMNEEDQKLTKIGRKWLEIDQIWYSNKWKGPKIGQ